MSLQRNLRSLLIHKEIPLYSLEVISVSTFKIFLHNNNCLADQPEIDAHPQNTTRIEGENVTLSCNATGNPVPNISWIGDGSSVNTTINSRISFSDDNKQLTITNVNRTDGGEYQCVAKNRVGSDASNAATLNVQCKTGVSLKSILTRF